MVRLVLISPTCTAALLITFSFCLPTTSILFFKTIGYFQYAGGFEPRQAFDITATVPNGEYNDPMFIVEAVKKRA
jgi:hypothetical protein